jgi:uncharacterized protein YbaP (TraB family)
MRLLRFAPSHMAALAIAWAFSTSALSAPVCPAPPTMPRGQHETALQHAAVDHGFLWSIVKSGHRSWLYGTLHIARESWMFPGPKVRQALESSKVVALELDLENAATMSELTALAKEGAGQIPPRLRPRMKRQLQNVCLPEGGMDRLHPALVFAAIEAYGLRPEGLESAYGIDGYLARIAHTRGIKVRALETPQSQMIALRGNDIAVSPADVEENLTRLENGTDRIPLERLVSAWAHSNLSDLDSYLTWCACQDSAAHRAEIKRLLDDRNPLMADAIDKMHRAGATVFAAVGALHMAGPGGLPALLAKRGYIVTPVPLP